MKLTVEEFTNVIREVAKKVKKEMAEWEPHEFKEEDMSWASAFQAETEEKKGRDGKAACDCKKGECKCEANTLDQPRGFRKSESGDFSKNKDGLYKRQGNSNMGPYTSESILRTVIAKIVKEEFNLRPIPKKNVARSAPYSLKAEVGEKGTVVNTPMKGWSSKKAAPARKQFEHWYNKHLKVKNESSKGSDMSKVFAARKKK